MLGTDWLFLTAGGYFTLSGFRFSFCLLDSEGPASTMCPVLPCPVLSVDFKTLILSAQCSHLEYISKTILFQFIPQADCRKKNDILKTERGV